MRSPYLLPDEIDALFSRVTHPRDTLLARFLYESGCSVGEITTLRKIAIQADGTVRFADRKARITPQLAQALLASNGTYVFSTRQGDGITAKRVQQILRPYLQSFHKSKHSPHVLRYSHVIHAYQRGVNLSAISAQTGIGLQRLAQIVENISGGADYANFFGGGRP